MNTLSKLLVSHSNTSKAWKPLAQVAALVVTLLLCAATGNAYTILTLTGDLGQSTTDNYTNFHTTAAALAATTNDTFAYNVLSPTTPLPQRSYSTSPNGYHGPDQPSVTVAYTFGTVVGSEIIFDLYGRSDEGAQYRDNGLVLKLYNGDWITPVFTSAPFDVSDSAPYYTRFTSPNVFSDRVSITRTPITGDNYFTLMEIRAVVPEPSISLLAIVGSAFLLRRWRS